MHESAPMIQARWCTACSILNLRCDVQAPGVRHAVADALGLALPEAPNTTVHNTALRILWIGPDEWLVLHDNDAAHALETRLRAALAGQHMAVTDVSSYYQMLQLAGTSARDVLAQGCPLDLHPRVFLPNHCAGSHYFKATIWLWQVDTAYTLLIRRSFAGYIWSMIERASAEYVQAMDCNTACVVKLTPQRVAT